MRAQLTVHMKESPTVTVKCDDWRVDDDGDLTVTRGNGTVLFVPASELRYIESEALAEVSKRQDEGEVTER